MRLTWRANIGRWYLRRLGKLRSFGQLRLLVFPVTAGRTLAR